MTVVGFAVTLIIGLIIIALGLILNFMYSNVFKLVLFDYANGKGLPPGFNELDINKATRQRRSRFGGFTGSNNF